MYIKFVIGFILITGTFLLQNCNSMPKPVTPIQALPEDREILTPYRSENGKYGYVNKEMKLVIPAIYTSAVPFTTTGFAIVSEADEPLHMQRNHYGVINKKGKLVIPYEHDQIYMEVLDNNTLIWTKQVYLNRWRFWEWQGLLFGDNFLSSAPLIDTKVRRAKVQLGVLESGFQIQKKRTYGLAPILEAIPLEKVDSTRFLQGNQLYHLQKDKPIRVAKNIYGRTSGNLLLQQQSGYYRLINLKGKVATDMKFKKRKFLRINIEGNILEFPVENIKKMPTVYGVAPIRYIFEDEMNNQYLFPDFEFPFPNRVEALSEEDIPMETVLNRSRLTPGIEGSGRFYFYWNNFKEEKRIFETDESGAWKQHSDGGNYQKWLKKHSY